MLPVCKIRAEREKHEIKYKGIPEDIVIRRSKENLARLGRSYLAFLFSETQGFTGINTDIVKGLGAFDLKTLLVDPLELATNFFGQLFGSVCLVPRFRGYYGSRSS